MIAQRNMRKVGQAGSSTVIEEAVSVLHQYDAVQVHHWTCDVCGMLHSGTAPTQCDSCGAEAFTPQGELRPEIGSRW